MKPQDGSTTKAPDYKPSAAPTTEPYKTNPWVHTCYISVISLIILIYTIVLMSRESVSEAAMANVSFAATIVSIMLAVISVVVSVNASFKTNQNLGGMQDVATRLNETSQKLEAIFEHVTSTEDKVDRLQGLISPTPQSEIEAEAKVTVNELEKTQPEQKKKFTIEDIKRCERKAVEKIINEYRLILISIDSYLRTMPRQIFDGIARKGDVHWLIEVKLYRPDLVPQLIKRLWQSKIIIETSTGEPVEMMAVLLLTDSTNKDEISNNLTPIFEENGLRVHFYYISELMA